MNDNDSYTTTESNITNIPDGSISIPLHRLEHWSNIHSPMVEYVVRFVDINDILHNVIPNVLYIIDGDKKRKFTFSGGKLNLQFNTKSFVYLSDDNSTSINIY